MNDVLAYSLLLSNTLNSELTYTGSIPQQKWLSLVNEYIMSI